MPPAILGNGGSNGHVGKLTHAAATPSPPRSNKDGKLNRIAQRYQRTVLAAVPRRELAPARSPASPVDSVGRRETGGGSSPVAASNNPSYTHHAGGGGVTAGGIAPLDLDRYALHFRGRSY